MAVKAGPFRPALSGDNIDVERTHEEAEKMKVMIDFQWALSSIFLYLGLLAHSNYFRDLMALKFDDGNKYWGKVEEEDEEVLEK